jgi:transcriptional regulator with XRE-family HTH domain
MSHVLPPYPFTPPAGYPEFRPLVEWRYKLGVTQSAVATAMGVSTSLIGTLERGERPVSESLRDRYAVALSAIEARIDAIRARLDELPPPARPMTPADLRSALSGSPDRLPVPWGRGEGAGHE